MSDYTNSAYQAVEVVLIGLHDTYGHNSINSIPLCLQKKYSKQTLRGQSNTTAFSFKYYYLQAKIITLLLQFYSHQLMHFFIQLRISLLSYIKIT